MQTHPYNPKQTAGDKLRAFANKLNNGNKLSMCSLLLVTGIAATLAVMAQETQPAITQPTAAPPAVTQPTMPIERAITNTKGQALEGTILSKKEGSIAFKTKAGKEVEIKLDQLSAEDQTFISTLIDKKAAKPTVLFLLDQEFTETAEVRAWLSDNGFDVKIGVTSNKGSYKIPQDTPITIIKPIEIIETFDIVWINRFQVAAPEEGREDFNHFAITDRLNRKNKLVVIPTKPKLASVKRFTSIDNYYTGNPKTSDSDKPFVEVEGKVIFCSNNQPSSTDAKMREKLLEAIKTALN